MVKQSVDESDSRPGVVEVIAPGRLHLGFLDMHGGLGRNFGSLGVCLSEIRIHLSARRCRDIVIQGPSSHRVSLYAGRILEHLGIADGAEIHVHESIQEHAGLGSGTQLSLAVGTALARLYGQKIPVIEIARVMERGTRSGIGVGAFLQGGFLVDGGRGLETEVPPIICRQDFPEAWRFLLVLDNDLQGMHGPNESEVFRCLPPMSPEQAGHLSRLTLMQLLPALVEKDCDCFGKTLTEIQAVVGDHFSRAQGGRYCSTTVGEVLSWLDANGAAGTGQSSWGPTGFGLFANETQAYSALKQAREKWGSLKNINFRICKAQNHKAEIRYTDAAENKTANLKTI